ncbi:MAG TPA: hypothetical protein VGC57_09080 [Cellulomonas sp.]
MQQAVRLLLAGQITTAAIVARSQLERWTENLADNHGMKKLARESARDYAERVWISGPLSNLGKRSSKRYCSIDGLDIFPGDVVDQLNKLIHAEEHAAAVEWANLGYPGDGGAGVEGCRPVSHALMLCIRQLRFCVANALWVAGEVDSARIVAEFETSTPRWGVAPPMSALWPANLLLLQSEHVRAVAELSGTFDAVRRGERPDGRLYTDAEMGNLAFCAYRFRALTHAQRAFDSEAEIVGPLTQENLAASELPPVITSEMAAALARWLPEGGHPRAAADSIADALRGAYWLWVEDDMRSMSALRVALEQAARLRVWRLKPRHAERLEVDGSPARWIEKAGWKRLGALNRALGDLSHFRLDSDWGSAFDLLVLLNPAVRPDEAPNTARRHALEVVTRLASREIRGWVRVLDPDVAVAFDAIAGETLSGGEAVDHRIEEYLNFASTFRSLRFPNEAPLIRDR